MIVQQSLDVLALRAPHQVFPAGSKLSDSTRLEKVGYDKGKYEEG